MADLNHKLIYEAQPLLDEMRDARARVREAETKLERLEQGFLPRLAKLAAAPVGDLEQTNIACMARGVLSHVFRGSRGAATGVGHRRCIFCGADDFSD